MIRISLIPVHLLAVDCIEALTPLQIIFQSSRDRPRFVFAFISVVLCCGLTATSIICRRCWYEYAQSLILISEEGERAQKEQKG